MPTWEEIANEVVPPGHDPGGLATGARRATRPSSGGWQRPLARPESELCVLPPPQAAPNAAFDEVLGGAEKICARRGAHYEIVRAAASYDAPFGGLTARLEKALGASRIAALDGARAEDLIVLDIETSGVGDATPLFLIGTLRFDAPDNAPQMEFFLARDTGEEGAALAAFHARFRGKRLVTFNGKSFDWPFIARRSRARSVPFSNPPAHLDMLHEARKLWRGAVPDCRLQTLERFLCGRGRQGDVPGWKIPGQYLEFVERRRAGQNAAWLLAPILHHNALDLLTLAELVCLAHE